MISSRRGAATQRRSSLLLSPPRERPQPLSDHSDEEALALVHPAEEGGGDAACRRAEADRMSGLTGEGEQRPVVHFLRV